MEGRIQHVRRLAVGPRPPVIPFRPTEFSAGGFKAVSDPWLPGARGLGVGAGGQEIAPGGGRSRSREVTGSPDKMDADRSGPAERS